MNDKGHPYTGEWYDKRNERRQERYHSDPKLRKRINTASRDGYREREGVKMPFDPRVNLSSVRSFGTYRTVKRGGAEVLTFTKAELGEVLGRPTKQVQQWAADGRIPSTILKAKKENVDRMPLDVYSEYEVIALIESIGEHLATMLYFRRDHVDAIKTAHNAISAVRS